LRQSAAIVYIGGAIVVASLAKPILYLASMMLDPDKDNAHLRVREMIQLASKTP
jgi:hypothetical protein